MSQTTVAVESDTTTSRVPAVRAVRAGVIAVVAGLVLNLVAFGVGKAAGADLLVTQPGADAPMAVGGGNVAVMTVAPLVLGTVALAVAGRWGARGWNALAWLGLALGIVTVAMPFTVGATTGTSFTLASMHVITGIVWWAVLRQLSIRATGSP